MQKYCKKTGHVPHPFEFGAVWLQMRVDEIQVQQFCFTVDVYYCIAYYGQSPNKWSTTIYYVT